MLFAGALSLLFLQTVVAERHDADLMSFVTVSRTSSKAAADV
jgi:hypothetical protein